MAKIPVSSLMQRLALMGVALFVVSMVGQFRVPVLPDIGRDLGLTTTDLGRLTALFAAGRLLTDLPAGVVVDRLGVRRVVIGVGVISAAASWMFATSQGRGVVLAAAFLLGVASATSNLMGMTYFANSATADRRGAAMAGYGIALRGGASVGPVVAGAIATFGGWRTAMWTGGAITALLAGIAVVARAALPAGPATADRQPSATPSAAREWRRVRAFSTPQQLVLALVPFTTLFAQGALIQTIVPIIGVDTLGLTTAFVGVALGFGGATQILGMFVGGFAADRIGRKSTLVPGLLLQAAAVALLAIEGAV